MLSIIIPVYNGAEWLAEAIISCLEQGVHVFDIELIVVNDGSTDNFLEVIQQFKEEFPIKVISQVNKGLASARNTGIMNAKGEYCLFLDADDILLPNAIKKILETIQENPDVDIVAPSFREFGLGKREVVLMENPTIEDFKTGNRIGYCSAVRKSVLLEVGGYN